MIQTVHSPLPSADLLERVARLLRFATSSPIGHFETAMVGIKNLIGR